MNLNDKRLEKERGRSPKSVLEDYLARNDIGSVIVIAKSSDDGHMETTVCADSDDEALVMLSKAQHMEMNWALGVYDE